MKANSQFSLSSKYWALILAIVCVFLMGLSGFAETGKGPLGWIANYTIVPMQKGINTVGTLMSDFTENFATLKEVRAENKELKEKVAELTIENNRLQQNSAKLERYEKLFKMDENTSDYPKVGANVIASDNSNWFTKFTIDKGSKDGIKKDMNVLSGAGLVGIITEVRPHSATVSTIIDDKNISAMILTTFDKCIVSGDLTLINDGVVKFEQLANNDNEVPIGEQVVTSNISDKYLQGLLIGYISDISVDSNNLTKSGFIIPATNFRELQEVLVITTTKDELVNDAKDTEPSKEDAKQKTSKDTDSTKKEQ